MIKVFKLTILPKARKIIVRYEIGYLKDKKFFIMSRNNTHVFSGQNYYDAINILKINISDLETHIKKLLNEKKQI